MSKKVIVDCDARIKPFIELMFKMKFSEVQIEGITTTEEKQKSVDFILDTIRKHPDIITIVALSELTNIAAAIEQDEKTMESVKELIIAGGSECIQGDYSPVSEENFGKNPKAARNVFADSSIKKIMIGLDVTESLMIPSFLKKAFVAMGMLTDNTMVRSKKAYVQIETDGIAAGQSVCDNAGEFHEGETNAEIISYVDSDKIFSVIFREEQKDERHEKESDNRL